MYKTNDIDIYLYMYNFINSFLSHYIIKEHFFIVAFNPFTAYMPYMYIIKTLLLFACMTYMYVMHVSKDVAVVLDPTYDI